MLLGRARLSPPPPLGLYPFLAQLDPPKDPHECITSVSFSHRREQVGGGFHDFTARYGAVREEDRTTLRQSIMTELTIATQAVNQSKFEKLANQLDLQRLLDLPLVSLSNGQTRRARIMQKLLLNPVLLILDEPLSERQYRCLMLYANIPKLGSMLNTVQSS